MKRGQITLFIIVGIVVLFVAAFSMYIIAAIEHREPIIEEPPEQLQDRLCLRSAAEGALRTVGLQGGTNEMQSTVLANGEQVRIGIRQGSRVTSEQFSNPATAWFGSLNLQPLCLANGPNRPNAGLDETNTCLPGTYNVFQPVTDVLQYQVKVFTEQNLEAAGCNQGPVTVVFGGDDVTVFTANTTARIPVRFKRMYNAAYMVALAEMKTITFNADGATTIPGCDETSYRNECLFNGMSVTAVDEGSIRVVTIADSVRQLEGEPFVFRFAIENRYPVITSLPAQPIAVTADNTAAPTTITVSSADPDEDSISVTCQLDSGDPLPNWITCANDGTIRFTPTCIDSNTEFTYTVTDSHGASTTTPMTTTVVRSSSC
jgi:hypothetical protein